MITTRVPDRTVKSRAILRNSWSAGADGSGMLETELAVHVIADGRFVMELHERLTSPGPALELHVARDSETRVTRAWWETEEGSWLGEATVGKA